MQGRVISLGKIREFTGDTAVFIICPGTIYFPAHFEICSRRTSFDGANIYRAPPGDNPPSPLLLPPPPPPPRAPRPELCSLRPRYLRGARSSARAAPRRGIAADQSALPKLPCIREIIAKLSARSRAAAPGRRALFFAALPLARPSKNLAMRL